MALTQGLRRLPALYGLKISTERANKTQGQELYDRMNNRTAQAFGTNVAFKRFSLGSLSLLLPGALPALPPASLYIPSPAAQIAERWKVS